MTEENSLGEMLNTAIRRMGWTHQQVADRFDQAVSRVTVSRWVRDLQRPSDYHLKQLVAILGFNEEEAYALFRAARLEPPKKHNLSSRNRLFTGRENCLEQLVEHFKAEAIIALSGLPGIGKTQLALEYAHRCDRTQVYSAVLWVNADKASLQSSYADLAEALQLPEQDEGELYRRVQAVTQWLKRHTNWLLIMDNADDLELASSFFPDAHRGHILLTTRTQIVGGIARQIEIEKMGPEEAQLFLLRRSRVLDVKATLDTVATNVREAARQIVELLDRHPLALDQAGAFIEDGGSFTTYKDLYDKQRRDLLDRRGSLKGADCDYPETVAVTFALCFNKARTQHPLADDILNFCAFLHPEAIPEELFQHDDSFKLDTLAFTDGITALLQYSLIKRNTQNETLSMHRLVQAVLIDAMSAELQKQWRERVLRALSAAFPLAEFRDWSQCERLLPHALLCSNWKDDELTPSLEVFVLFRWAGIYSLSRGQYSDAEMLLSRVLPINKQRFGVEHPYTASALNDLGALYSEQGRYSKAEPLLQQALTIHEKLFGVENPDTAKSLHDLAVIYMRQGRYSKAEPLFQQVIAIHEKLFGAEYPNTAYPLTSLAYLYFRQGNDSQAESLLLRALRILEKHKDAKHPNIAFPLYRLAMVLHKQGRHEQAEVLYQRTLSIIEQQLLATHPLTQAIKREYADFLRSIRLDAEAAPLAVNDEPSA